ncbi:MAG: MoaD/ThiS family protein [Anaerolineae bacterium]|jgi:molybdopterin converting factor small subunit
MIKVTVHHYNMLRRLADQAREQVELPEGADVLDALRALSDRYGPAAAELLFSSTGEPASHLVVFVNGQLTLPSVAVQPLADGDELKLLPAISGG